MFRTLQKKLTFLYTITTGTIPVSYTHLHRKNKKNTDKNHL